MQAEHDHPDAECMVISGDLVHWGGPGEYAAFRECIDNRPWPVHLMLGNHDKARTSIDRARGMAPDDPYTYYYDGMVFLRAGDKDAAIAALEIAAEKGYSRELLGVEPHLEELRNDRRFAAVVDGG